MVPRWLQLTCGRCFPCWGQPPQRLDQQALWPGRGRAVADVEKDTGNWWPQTQLKWGPGCIGRGMGRLWFGWAGTVTSTMC